MYLPYESSPMSALSETIVAKFGGRISLNFRPQTREIFYSPLGRFFDCAEKLNFGILYDGVRYALPFGNGHTDFQYTEQHEYFDRVVFVCRDYRIGVRAEFSLIAPFYPQDEALCTLPALFCEVKAERLVDRALRADDRKEIAIFCDVRMSGFKECGNCLKMRKTYGLTDDHIHYQDTEGWNAFLRQNRYTSHTFRADSAIVCREKSRPEGNLLLVSGEIGQGIETEAHFVLAGYTDEDVLDVRGEKMKLLYADRFASVEEVASYALSRYEIMERRSALFCDMLKKADMTADYFRLLGLAMRSFAANVWLCEGGRGKWFSVWEGNCLFHSTVDVEYNIGVFYLMFWPELLAEELKNWADALKGVFLPHDVGGGLTVGECAYPHDMPVEENCNFILLLYASYKMRGRKDLAAEHADLAEKLIDFIRSCDKTGNGLANEGTANTIDDSSDNVQFAQEQIYLGIKEYAAYVAAGEMFAALGRDGMRRACKEEADKIRASIESCGWRGDHYAVNLIESGGKLHKDSIYKSIGVTGEKGGKDAYSIYTSNGLLYLLMTGTDLGWDRERLRKDMLAARSACMTAYGCTHSSVDTSNVWISQNIWRDMAACYLGEDFSGEVSRYAEYERYENQGGRGGCFIDTYGWNKLNYYPRGIAAVGMIYARGGVSVDAVRRTVRLDPCSVPCSVPLFGFADWESGNVPVVHVFRCGSEVRYWIENRALLGEYTVETCLIEEKR